MDNPSLSNCALPAGTLKFSLLSAAIILSGAAANAATLERGYLLGSEESQLLLSNDGAGSVLFADVAAIGGADVNVTGGNVSPFASVLLDGSASWNIGDTVSITGFAMPLVASATQGGTFTFNIRQGAGGGGPSSTSGLSSLGTADVTFTTDGGGAGVFFANFDTPVTFEADANSTSIVLNWSSTGHIRYKTQGSGDLPQVNYGNGNFTGSAVRVSIAGTVIPEPGTYALLGGLAVLGFVALRRRNRR